MDATGTVDQLGCKLFVLLTNSCAGGLPVGIIITSVETDKAIAEGLKLIKEMTPESHHCGEDMEILVHWQS